MEKMNRKKELLSFLSKISYFAARVAVSGVSRRGMKQPKESESLRSRSLF